MAGELRCSAVTSVTGSAAASVAGSRRTGSIARDSSLLSTACVAASQWRDDPMHSMQQSAARSLQHTAMASEWSPRDGLHAFLHGVRTSVIVPAETSQRP